MNLWHIGILTDDIERNLNAFSAVPGADPDGWKAREMVFAPETMRVGEGGTLKIAMCVIGGVRFEFIEPVTETSYHYQELKKKGSGTHHVAYFCKDDIAEVLAGLLAKGGRVVWEMHRKEHVYYVEMPDEGMILEIIDAEPA
jgi:catechol 2,3-dioxygenase-like lactoylglutathione lyase family enzyme